MSSSQLRYSVNESPSLAMVTGLAALHVLLIFDGIIFVPNVLGKVGGLDQQSLQFITFASIIVAAAFTYLQSRKRFGLGAGFILFAGSYSGFLACSIDAISMGGLPLMAAATLLTVPVIFLYTYFIRFFRHIITPAVGGIVILLIGVSLVPISLELWAGTDTSAAELPLRVTVGGVTVAVLTVLMLFGNGAMKLWSPAIGMASGYVTAAMCGQLNLENFQSGAWFGLPPLAWPGIEMNIGAVHVPLLLAFSMGMLASMIENTGNIMLVQQISKRNFRRVSYDTVQSGLYCDGASKVAAGLLGTAVPSTYCDNLPIIEMTGVASRRVGQIGAVLLLLLAFMPKVSGLVLDMPGPVIGGFLLVISGLLFHAGIGLVTMNRLTSQNGLILGLSLTVGLVAESGTFFPGIVPDSLSPMLSNSVAIGGFTAFALSTLAYLFPKKTIQGVFKARAEEFPKLREMLALRHDTLEIGPKALQRLTLCCEEMFFHMIGDDSEDPERNLSIKLSRTDDGLFVEALCGHRMNNIGNFAMPDNLYRARPEELNTLGLMLFAKFAEDVKHMEISGYSYISFTMQPGLE